MSDNTLAGALASADALVGEFLTRLYEHVGPAQVTPEAQAAKLLEEVDEAVHAMTSRDKDETVKELADVIIVCALSARLLGARTGALADAVAAKMAVNLERQWAASGATARHV